MHRPSAFEKIYKQPEQEVAPGFDLRTHIRDDRTGKVVQIQPYRMYSVKSGDGSIQYFERPVGSGNLYYKSGEPAGTFEGNDKQGNPIIKVGAEHNPWTPPPTADQLHAKELSLKEQEIRQLKKQLAQIEKERKAPASAKPEGTPAKG